MTPALLIGIGNRLRGDDGVGALLVETWNLEAAGRRATAQEVAVQAVHQLTPELALTVAQAPRVLFVDAWANPDRPDPWIEALRPGTEPDPAEAGGHGWGPRAVVALAERLYGWQGEAALLRVPAFAFPHGLDLSPGLRQCLPLARALMGEWLRRGEIAEAAPV